LHGVAKVMFKRSSDSSQTRACNCTFNLVEEKSARWSWSKGWRLEAENRWYGGEGVRALKGSEWIIDEYQPRIISG
jgi:hypothetical protein